MKHRDKCGDKKGYYPTLSEPKPKRINKHALNARARKENGAVTQYGTPVVGAIQVIRTKRKGVASVYVGQVRQTYQTNEEVKEARRLRKRFRKD